MEINSNTESAFAEVNRTHKFDEECLHNSVLNRNFSTVYYGIYVPSDGQQNKTVGTVFTDKTEVLDVVKRNKKARFKSFHYYHEAAEFATHGADLINSSISNDDLHKKQDQAIPVTEKLQFRGPKIQDLVKLRKAIEAGDVTFVETAVWENPRYLISSGDTPSILQEGVRYNALHVAAKAKHSEMCELILNTIGNLDFIELLYGDDHQNSEERAKILLDLYLNTPDKGLNESPLHLAVKFGAVKVVEILVSFPQCDKFIKNKYGKLPSQIICERCDGYTSEKIKNDIAMLLEENYYVPVLRSEGNCNPPIIGEPFSPSSPPTYNANLVDGRVEIHAYAGPMNKKGAESFRKVWKTPPRVSNPDYHFKSVNSPSSVFTDDIASLKLKDHEKGLEAVGRDLAAKYDVDWKEYWPFLASFIDLSSIEGLQQLETYLKLKSVREFRNENCASPILNFDSANEQTQNVSDVIENALCKAFQSLNLSSNGVAKSKSLFSECFLENDVSPIKSDLCPVLCVEKACQVFAHRIAADILHFRHSENSIVKALEMQLNCLEQLMLSYLDDDRFRDIKLHSVHARLGSLVLYKLLDSYDEYKLSDSCDEVSSIENLIEKVRSNYFKDNNQTGLILKNASVNKKLLCLLDFILSESNNEVAKMHNSNCEGDYKEIWEQCAECACNWQDRDKRKAYGSKRHKQKLRGPGKCLNSVSKRLFMEEDDEEDLDPEKYVTSSNLSDSTSSSSQNESDYSSSSEDEFYTPSNSISTYCSDEEQYCDSLLLEYDIFIEGKEPTKTDHNVFMALKYIRNKLNPKEYPYVYKWHHVVSLYSEEERRRWPASKNLRKHTSSASKTVSFAFHNVSIDDEERQIGPAHSSSKSWIRITGVYSPKASLRIRNNVSYNL